MTLVKPPSLEDLLKFYGSLKAVIEHLLQSGLSPEDIERKYSIPYYFIQLTAAGFEKKGVFPFYKIAEIFERIALLRSAKGKETELLNLFKFDELNFEWRVRLALGGLVEDSLGIGPALIEESIATATSTPVHKVRDLFHDYGDYGDVASFLVSKKEPSLTVEEVMHAFNYLKDVKGGYRKIKFLASLLTQATAMEAKYLIRLVLQDLKLGYHETTVMNAIARALNVNRESLEWACSILGYTKGLLLADKGDEALLSVKFRPGTFIPPQLAHLYEPDKVRYPALVESKFDGSRLQIHKWGTSIWLFSRRGVEKSKTLPEVVEVAKKFKGHSFIVDSEVVAVDKEGKHLPFQALLHRTVPREFEEERAEEVGLTIRAFDILYLDGRDLRSLPLLERREYLKMIVPREYLSEGIICYSEKDLISNYERALESGFEGILVKSINSPYEVGERTYTWLKFKPERDSLDCVVVKALYGKGRRAGYFSSFELAVRDPVEKKLYTVGRVSNLSDEMMAKIRDIIEGNVMSEDKEGAYVKPLIVFEVTYQEIQATDEYTSGFALRVPKVVRIRGDKTVEDIDTVEKVQKLFSLQYEERFKVKTV